MADPLSLFLALFSALISAASCEYSAEECWNLGFNKANLLCSSCNHLNDFDLDVLGKQCKECCIQEGKNTTLKLYPKAVLEVCG